MMCDPIREWAAGVAGFAGSVPHNYSTASQHLVLFSTTDQRGVALNTKHGQVLPANAFTDLITYAGISS